MKARLTLAALAAAALLLGQSLSANDKDAAEKEFSAKCPVSGRDAKEDKTVEYRGKNVYFCCDNCPKAFEKDPEKYAAKAHHQLLSTGQIVLVACPLTGRDLNPDTAVELDGVEVAFCCNNCKGKFSKSDDQIALVFADLSKGFTLQTECPVSGKPIDIAQKLEHDGKKVFFCCEKCPAAFEKDPEKFVSKLPQFNEEDTEK